MIRVQAWNEFGSPKFYGPLAIWPWLRISPQRVLWMLSIIWSLWPDNDWWTLLICPVFLCKLYPIKVHWGRGSWPFSFKRSATFLPQADHVLHVLVDLFSSVAAGEGGGPVGRAPPQSTYTQWWGTVFWVPWSSLSLPIEAIIAWE